MIDVKYKIYPEYKNSGVEWIGEIPEHWSLTKVKFISTCLDGARIPLNATERSEMNGDIPYWGANNIVDYVNDYLFDEDLILLGEDGAPFFDKTKDVAFNVSGKIWPNNHVHVLRPEKRKVDSRFYKYALNCSDFHLYISGSTRDKLNQSDMNEIYIRNCDLNEQKQIANFLEHETAKIDTLIEKQIQLIKLLKEKRQAVISHAVTQGLNPDAPMRDSGVEWLGEVPEHWEVAPTKHLCKFIKDGTHLPPPRVDNGIPLLSVRNIIDSKFVFREDDSNISKEDYQDLCRSFIPEQGDVLLAIVGATLGKVAIVNKMSKFHIQRSLGIFRVDPNKMSNETLFYIFSSTSFQSLLWEYVGFSAQPGIYLGTLENFTLPVPPLEEQIKINDYCKSNTLKFDLLIKKAEKGIKLIQERRTALISAAVTGKIDVRDWKPVS
ncbi:MAG: restriction endonuclease subunit S [Spirochaetaceae bacterium]|jgi:type I restriction enzyme S subunit|nr:restriction endonuclease subunit S [Spirochaetaceae bacterium]